jgi:hypothetical protein
MKRGRPSNGTARGGSSNEEDYAFPRGYTILKDYVRQRKPSQRESSYHLRILQVRRKRISAALVVIAGQEKAHYLCLDLPHSDGLLPDGIFRPRR